MESSDRFLTVAEAAERTTLSVRTIRRQIHAGRLPARRAGSRILISEADLGVWWSGLEPVAVAEPVATTSTGTLDCRW